MSAADAPAVAPRDQEPGDRPEQLATDAWARIGRWAAYCAAAAFVTQSVLFLLDVTGALAPRVSFTTSGGGLEQDLIEFYVRHSERMHGIWWDVAVRDVVGPLGYLALVVTVQATVYVARSPRPRQELGRLFIMIGAAAAALSDLMYLGHVAWWRPGPLQPTADVIAHGRAFEVVDTVGQRIQWGGLLVLALGLVCIAPTLGAARLEHRRLSVVAHLQAAALGAFVAATAAGADTAALVASAAAGLVLGPVLAILLGHSLRSGRPQLQGSG